MKNILKISFGLLITATFSNFFCSDDGYDSDNSTVIESWLPDESQDDLDVSFDHNPDNPRGDSTLMIAAFHSNQQEVESLLQGNVNLDFKNQDGKTALHYAAVSDDGPIARLLLKTGANPEATDYENNTPLHLAANFNAFTVAKELMQYGANPFMQNNEGNSSFDCAHNNRMKAILQKRIHFLGN